MDDEKFYKDIMGKIKNMSIKEFIEIITNTCAAIEHKDTDEIVCPWCGYEYDESWRHSDAERLYCDECDKTFYVTSKSHETYTTEKVEYGTCDTCKKENVWLKDKSTICCDCFKRKIDFKDLYDCIARI